MIVNVYIKIKVIAKLRIKNYIKNGMNTENTKCTRFHKNRRTL